MVTNTDLSTCGERRAMDAVKARTTVKTDLTDFKMEKINERCCRLFVRKTVEPKNLYLIKKIIIVICERTREGQGSEVFD